MIDSNTTGSIPATPSRDDVQNISKQKVFLFKSVLVVTIVLLGALFSEVLLRMFSEPHDVAHLRKISIRYRSAGMTRFAMTPHQEIDRGDGRIYRINSHGLRGPDITTKRPECVRILILGGSSVFDQNLTEGKDWPHRVESLLRKATHQDIEVINGGVPGFTSADALGILHGHLWMMEPDIVILYNAWNDIKYFTHITPDSPLLTWTTGGATVNDPRLRYGGWVDRLLGYSELYSFLRYHYLKGRLHIGREGIIRDGKPGAEFSPLALKQYKLNIQLFIDLCQNIGATPVLMKQATLISPENSPEQQSMVNYLYQLLTHDALVSAYFDCNRTVEDLSLSEKVMLIDAASEMSGKTEFFSDHVHLTDAGSFKIAELVSQHLVDMVGND